jgi:hypothetical protein
LAFIPFVTVIGACGFGKKTASADEAALRQVVEAKLALLPLLGNFPNVAQHQQRHIDVLSTYLGESPQAPTQTTSTVAISVMLGEMSHNEITFSLQAKDAELGRLLMLVAASDAVHSRVTA